MADIDKALPNEPRKEITLPGQEEIEEQIVETAEEEQASPDAVEVVENEDGSVDINMDPAAATPEGGDEHYANLAEFLPDDVLGSLGSELNQKYMDYSMSRKDWEKSYTQGLDLYLAAETDADTILKAREMRQDPRYGQKSLAGLESLPEVNEFGFPDD